MAEWESGLFALPSGVDFAGHFVAGFLRRMKGQPPEAIARVTIYANSAQTLAAFRHAFDAHGPLLLPNLLTVNDLGAGNALRDGPLAAPLARRLQLAQLIDRLLQSRPDLAAGNSISALTQSLAALMAEMQTEGCGADALEEIDAGDHARHWQNALDFLRIATRFHLDGPPVDRPARQRIAAGLACDNWTDGRNLPTDPVIVAGSTGSHGATRLFMRAVAGLPNGAVVLPGFDFDLPRRIWDKLSENSGDHPQFRFAPLVEEFGTPRLWSPCDAPSLSRNRLISLALRPAPVTDQWIAEAPQLPDLQGACEGMTLIEADQPGQEADAIALIMREAAERAQPVTLFAADSGLIRRVVAALDRWRLHANDSSGEPVHLTAPGLFLRHVAAIFGMPMTVDRLLILLKHPLTASGSDVVGFGAARYLARELELHLRAYGPAFPGGDSLRDWGDKGDATRKIWALWLAAILDRIAGFAEDRAARPLPGRLADLRDLTETLIAGPDGNAAQSESWAGRSGRMAAAVLDDLANHAAKGPPMRPEDFAALLTDELRAQTIRDPGGPSPLLRIRGPREARTEAHGTVILSGLNEGEWPQPLDPDPWLSRQMRVQAGLTLPERQIGLAGHDFQQGISAGRVYLTRARRNAEAETVPSRWLNRLTNLIAGAPERHGPEALADMRERGANWLGMARALSRPERLVLPEPRPAPVPPAPPFRQLPVTEIAQLIRDPYAVYAKHVLGLRRLNPLRPEPDAALRGQTLHSIVERLLKTGPGPDVEAAELRARLMRITTEVLEEQVPWPSARVFWQARIERIADQVVSDELARLAEGRPQIIEERGAVSVTGMDFRLIAKPDRIDLLHDGRVMIYDYKSGRLPTAGQMAHFDKQLMLEAAMARRGGFTELGPVEIAGIRYIQLGGEGRTESRDYSEQAEAESWDGFVRLIGSYLSGQAGFVAMRAPELRSYAGDYDHLARYGEWVLTEKAQSRKVGDHG